MYRVATLALGSLLIFLLIDTALAKHVRATWYGHELGGRKTASGQIFKPRGLTAAHKSLPFGTCLVIGNPKTGKSVRVTVNDRGPFTRGVSLDLSLGAAQAIGMRSTQTVSMSHC
jgi:rare lipoprotein A